MKSSTDEPRLQVVQVKNELANTKPLTQVNSKELYTAKHQEEELLERRNELTGEGKLEPVPEPGHNKYAHLHPI